MHEALSVNSAVGLKNEVYEALSVNSAVGLKNEVYEAFRVYEALSVNSAVGLKNERERIRNIIYVYVFATRINAYTHRKAVGIWVRSTRDESDR
jgi:hypothetical protein